MALHNLAAALVDVALIDMSCPERMEAVAVVDSHDLVVDIENLVVAPKCTSASDYVDK